MDKMFTARDLILQVRTALVELGFRATMADHDEMIDENGLRVLVGSGCGQVRVRLQRPSKDVPGRWIQVHSVDIAYPSQVTDKILEIGTEIEHTLEGLELSK